MTRTDINFILPSVLTHHTTLLMTGVLVFYFLYVPAFSQIDSYEASTLDRSVLVLKNKTSGAIEIFNVGEAVKCKVRGQSKVALGFIESIGDDFAVVGHDKIEFSSLRTISRLAPSPEVNLETGPARSARIEPYVSLTTNVLMDWSNRRLAFNFKEHRSSAVASTAIVAAALIAQIIQTHRANAAVKPMQTFHLKDFDVQSVVVD